MVSRFQKWERNLPFISVFIAKNELESQKNGADRGFVYTEPVVLPAHSEFFRLPQNFYEDMGLMYLISALQPKLK